MDNPEGTKDECSAWLKGEQEAGNIDISSKPSGTGKGQAGDAEDPYSGLGEAVGEEASDRMDVDGEAVDEDEAARKETQDNRKRATSTMQEADECAKRRDTARDKCVREVWSYLVRRQTVPFHTTLTSWLMLRPSASSFVKTPKPHQ